PYQNLLGHNHAEVSGDRREFGASCILAVKCSEWNHRRQIDDRHVNPLPNLVVLRHLGMKLAQIADSGIPVNDIRHSAGMEIRTAALRIVMNLLVHADTVKELLHNTLHGEEISLPVGR